METLKILQEFGGWPVVLGDKWNDTNFAWDEMIYNFYRAGYSTNLINLSVDTDLKNSTSRVIFVTSFNYGLFNITFLTNVSCLAIARRTHVQYTNRK